MRARLARARSALAGLALAGLALAVLGLAATSPALAGAWTMPEGAGQIIASVFGWTGAGDPWGGQPGVRQKKGEAQVYVQYGLTDQLTIFGQTGLERSILSGPESATYTGLDYSSVGLRKKLWAADEWVVSGEASVLAPGARDETSPAQAGNTGWAADVRLLLGRPVAFGALGGFLDLEGGYRWRTAGPPDEWHVDATVGLHLPSRMMLLLQEFVTVSGPSTDSSFPSWRSAIGQASLVVPMRGGWSLQVGWFQTLYVVRTNTERGVVAALWKDF